MKKQIKKQIIKDLNEHIFKYDQIYDILKMAHISQSYKKEIENLGFDTDILKLRLSLLFYKKIIKNNDEDYKKLSKLFLSLEKKLQVGEVSLREFDIFSSFLNISNNELLKKEIISLFDKKEPEYKLSLRRKKYAVKFENDEELINFLSFAILNIAYVLCSSNFHIIFQCESQINLYICSTLARVGTFIYEDGKVSYEEKKYENKARQKFIDRFKKDKAYYDRLINHINKFLLKMNE